MIRGHHTFIVRPLYLQFLMSFNNVLGERNSSALCTITIDTKWLFYFSLIVRFHTLCNWADKGQFALSSAETQRDF